MHCFLRLGLQVVVEMKSAMGLLSFLGGWYGWPFVKVLLGPAHFLPDAGQECIQLHLKCRDVHH